MLPQIPSRLSRIDETTVGQHFRLKPADQCYYLWEYTVDRDYRASATNRLIKNLKISPAEIAKDPRRDYWKLKAINHAGAALRQVITQSFVESRATFFVVPGSKAVGDPDCDDRMTRVLHAAFQGWNADIRSTLLMTRSTEADHVAGARIDAEALSAITALDEAPAATTRPIVVIVDDVLNSGKHFRVAQDKILGRYPQVEVRGVFLARCIRELDVSAEFDDLSDID